MLPAVRLADGTKAQIAGKRKAAADTMENIKYLQSINMAPLLLHVAVHLDVEH